MIRRRFIKGLVGGTGLLSGLSIFTRSAYSKNIDIEKSLCTLYFKRKSAARIGGNYLDNKPEENDRSLLIADICQGWSKQKALALMNSQQLLKTSIESQIQNDFVIERIVEIDGWILSRTEVLIFALIHINDKRTSPVCGSNLNEVKTGTNPYV